MATTTNSKRIIVIKTEVNLLNLLRPFVSSRANISTLASVSIPVICTQTWVHNFVQMLKLSMIAGKESSSSHDRVPVIVKHTTIFLSPTTMTMTMTMTISSRDDGCLYRWWMAVQASLYRQRNVNQLPAQEIEISSKLGEDHYPRPWRVSPYVNSHRSLFFSKVHWCSEYGQKQGRKSHKRTVIIILDQFFLT
jgi:hypothetical protein